MSKAVINLDKWGLLNYGKFFCAFGIADKHPKLGKNITVSHTSGIIKVEEKEDTYYFETHNSIYVCELGNISKDSHYRLDKTNSKSKVARVYTKYYRYKLYCMAKENNEALSKYGIRLNPNEREEFERIIELSALKNKEREEKIKLQNDKLIAEASKYSNCIFIDLSSISRGDNAAFNINGRTGIIKPFIHVGMFVDTMLYENTDNMDDYIDFRYYVRPMGLEPYSWTENIERVVIHNNKGVDIYFNHNITIKPDETVEILRKDIYK